MHFEVNGDLCGQFFNSYITLNHLEDFEIFVNAFVSKCVSNPSCGVIFHVHDHLSITALMLLLLHMIFLFILTSKLFFLRSKVVERIDYESHVREVISTSRVFKIDDKEMKMLTRKLESEQAC